MSLFAVVIQSKLFGQLDPMLDFILAIFMLLGIGFVIGIGFEFARYVVVRWKETNAELAREELQGRLWD